MTHYEEAPRMGAEGPRDEEELSALEFIGRKTGLTATVTIELKSATGERATGAAEADVYPGHIGLGVARIAGMAARILNADSDRQFAAVVGDLEEELKKQAPPHNEK
jgi:hypothetical protein